MNIIRINKNTNIDIIKYIYNKIEEENIREKFPIHLRDLYYTFDEFYDFYTNPDDIVYYIEINNEIIATFELNCFIQESCRFHVFFFRNSLRYIKSNYQKVLDFIYNNYQEVNYIYGFLDVDNTLLIKLALRAGFKIEKYLELIKCQMLIHKRSDNKWD